MNENATKRINEAAKLLIADIYFELPNCDTDTSSWETFFRREFAQLVQDQSFHRFRGLKLISWVRRRALAIYKQHIVQPYHIGSHQAGFLNHLASSLLSVIEATPEEWHIMSQTGCFVFYTYMSYCMNQGAIGRHDYHNTAANQPHSLMFFDICFN